MARGELFVALLCLCLAGLATSAAGARKMVGVYELRRGDFSVKITNWGAIVMSVVLPDSKGFPGAVDAYVTYRLSSPYTLGVHMNATALDKATPVNFLLHAYWNLGGHGSGDVLGHTLKLFASRHTVLDDELLPSSGRVEPVAGTPLDFRKPTAIGARIRKVMGGRIVGYDANYVIDGEGMRPVAVARDGASGRKLELWANQPTMQLYTGNWLNNTKGKDGEVYNQYGGFCLETMGYVDAVNHPEFPSQTLRPGQVYRHDMVFKFSF
ncbi:hypothetical protein PR202_gb15421 [Eleusine coracana subsp. coracana]|uniref:Aldose 1-epimerase n=1 Tax=Eleusine coracana subsp. coracana TaxID=191504 RepID=A0AAV5EYU6_ELECO|nr:hypothetical protein PR202_gb15421 [Eleusine coracana subsp. coracana]